MITKMIVLSDIQIMIVSYYY